MKFLRISVLVGRLRVPVWLIASVVLVALVGVTQAARSPGGGGQDASGPRGEQPNIVLIVTDDQTYASLSVMSNIQQVLVEPGLSFEDAIISLPVCCPARATMLTGQYAHNHQVLSNAPPSGGNDKLDHTNTLAVWLDEAGYTTSHVGKYLNSYGQFSEAEQPPGWDRWFTTIDPSTYQFWEYEVLDNGERRTYGTSDDEYQTDVTGARVVAEIELLANEEEPFFVMWSTLAPHVATGREQTMNLYTIPAPRHDGTLAGRLPPQPESFNEDDISDKPDFVGQYDPTSETYADRFRQRYLESLLAVDEWVGEIVAALENEDVLQNTIIVFLSDNGMMVGEHRVQPGLKLLPYEEVLRVPFIVRGPGFPAGEVSSLPVSNLELAPTLVRAAGAEAKLTMDGFALQDLLDDPDQVTDRAILIEAGNGGGRLVPRWEGVRTRQFTYVENLETGEVELYDRAADPNQLDSVHDDPAYAEVRDGLADTLEDLRGCEGDACRQAGHYTPPSQGSEPVVTTAPDR